MATEFGKLLKIIRINSGDSSKEMAKKLCLSPSYLSAIENGKRNIPVDLERLLAQAYPLTEKDREKLRSAMLQSSETIRLDLTAFDEKKQRIIIALTHDEVSEETLDRICDLIFPVQMREAVKNTV